MLRVSLDAEVLGEGQDLVLGRPDPLAAELHQVLGTVADRLAQGTAAHSVTGLEDPDVQARAGELARRGQAGEARTDNHDVAVMHAVSIPVRAIGERCPGYTDSYVNVSFRDTIERSRYRPGVAAEHPHYKWWALSCTSLGMLLATINSGTLIIALPDLERSLGTSLLQLVWVILAYMISSTVLVLTAGRLSDLFGRKKAYVGGFILFTLASFGAGFSGSGTELILWRILQGVGAAFLFANAAALVTDAFPKEQLGLAMGTNTMVAAVGLVIGPVLGGALVSIGWQWVFWFNIPLGLAGAVWGALVLHELAKPDTQRGLDLPALASSSSASPAWSTASPRAASPDGPSRS